MVASSNVCFPNRILDSLTRSYKSVDFLQDSFEFDLDMSSKSGINVLDFLNVKFKASLAKKTHVRFNDLRLRTLEVTKLLEYVNNPHFYSEENAFCRHLIIEQGLGMIGEIVEANGIEISFMDANGLGIVLSPKNIVDYINIDNSVGHQLIGTKKLKITSPKGIGYRLYVLGMNKHNNLVNVNAMTSGRTKKDGTFLLEPFQLRSFLPEGLIENGSIHNIKMIKSSPWPMTQPIFHDLHTYTGRESRLNWEFLE